MAMPCAVTAQDRYTSRPTQDGTLFFLSPKKLGNVKGADGFEFDMTYVTSNDSAYVNFSVKSKTAVRPTGLCLIYGNGEKYECDNYKLLFIDKHGSSYEIRVTSTFPFSVLREAFSSTESPVYAFNLAGTNVEASYKKSAWKKDRSRISEIFNLIDLMK